MNSEEWAMQSTHGKAEATGLEAKLANDPEFMEHKAKVDKKWKSIYPDGMSEYNISYLSTEGPGANYELQQKITKRHGAELLPSPGLFHKYYLEIYQIT